MVCYFHLLSKCLVYNVRFHIYFDKNLSGTVFDPSQHLISAANILSVDQFSAHCRTVATSITT